MTEVLFYHLQLHALEEVLPNLLERCLKHGWRAVVQTGQPDKIADLDAWLWTYRDDSFLPHGVAGGEFDAEQPILLTADDGCPNKAQVRFLIDQASISNISDYQRIVFIFDGHNEMAMQHARQLWKQLQDSAHQLSYWKQNDAGQWEKRVS